MGVEPIKVCHDKMCYDYGFPVKEKNIWILDTKTFCCEAFFAIWF